MFLRIVYVIIVICTTSILSNRDVEVKTEEDLGVKYANRCEVCKVLATELQNRLEETGKVRDVLEIGYSLDDVQPKKKMKYEKSELRLIESLDGVCEKILEYNIHKERQDSTRFAKGMSQTFKTLHGLVDKGVKVDLGIPYELWDKPSAEITHMKTQCESLLEDNEEAIEYWYWNLQGTKELKHHLCTDHALRNTDNSCLYESHNLKGDQGDKLKLNDVSSMTGGDGNVNDELEKSVDKDENIEKLYDQEYENYVHTQSKHTPSKKNLDLKKTEPKKNTKSHINEPDSEKSTNEQTIGEQGDNYWTEPAKYIQKHLRQNDIPKKVVNEPIGAAPDVNDNDEILEKFEPVREDL